MLQIISGKFFKTDDRHITECRKITYSNYSWVKPIKTCVATLEPTDLGSRVSPYVIRYKEQIEKPSVLICTDGSEIIQQFQLLCMFGLKAYFDTERNNLDFNCREYPRSSSDIYLPSKFVSHFFEPRIHGKKEEVDTFVKFVDKVIGLPREKYKGVMSCLNNFFHALQVLNYNIDIAYSMVVFSLESLCQNFEDYRPVWGDYYPEVKSKLEPYLSEVNPKEKKGIKKVLLESSNLKLQKRFIDFINDNLADSYFTNEANNVTNALRKSELDRVLKNAYRMRSGYTHQLKPILEQMKHPIIGEGDVLHWDNEPYLTFRGLVRLSHHVISNFIIKQEYLEVEECNWRDELSGIFTMELAPSYWIGEHVGFGPSHARKKFSGFLTQFQASRLSGSPMTDLRELLEKYESLIPTAKKQNKIAMLSMYHLYNSFIVPEARRPNYAKFLEKYKAMFDECCIESMIIHLLYNQKWPWDTEDCTSYYDNYKKNKFSKNTLSIPPLIELCLIAEIANMWLKAGDIEKYDEWLHTACLEASGKPDTQKLINECRLKRVEISYDSIFEITKNKS